MQRFIYALRRTSTLLAVVALTLTLMAALTGVLLAFYYQPTAGGAYESVKTLTTQVSYGWLIRTIHNLAGNLLIIVALIQMVVMFLSERFRLTWLTAWISGIFLILVAIGLDWTAMILNWSQLGFWRFRLELGTIEAIPLIGSYLRQILTGGDSISTVTVSHLYTLHSYVLSVAAVSLSVIHLVGLLFQERELKVVDAADLSPEALTDSNAAA
ncbi:MAG TPA: cytochrome bc complex cytochrome b subunit [Leptolyngbyaceae cyanobacterium M33_DOE_097]|uniref:Cytochrome bc complex cytochrome b subunit n=1 Tax=Oscillatoriales cyanobacterium SpSt-418 TaxID=2282169 RepID=A0A7C3PI83_9CYAN|nr:cytochrome bc complex cytochrome b subunit [Leptolyngbyaceae cyanobacterium M33_DOE_097]